MTRDSKVKGTVDWPEVMPSTKGQISHYKVELTVHKRCEWCMFLTHLTVDFYYYPSQICFGERLHIKVRVLSNWLELGRFAYHLILGVACHGLVIRYNNKSHTLRWYSVVILICIPRFNKIMIIHSNFILEEGSKEYVTGSHYCLID